jgi:hypothetical protein
MAIPGLQESQPMLDHQRAQSIEFMGSEPRGLCEIDRTEPEFRDLMAMFDMDVRRLRLLKAVEEEAESRISQYGRHRPTLVNEAYGLIRRPSMSKRLSSAAVPD